MSSLQGGKFGSGFASAGLTSALSPVVGNIHSAPGQIVASSIIGGTVSEVSGGKFVNGAVTAAFQAIFSGLATSRNSGNWDSDSSNPFASFGRRVLDLAGKIWALPDTLIGLAGGLAGLPFGANISFSDNAIVFNNYPWGPGGAITFGNVILSTTSSLDEMIPTYAAAAAHGPPYDDSEMERLGSHESAHTYQAQALGPFFLPAYILSGGAFTGQSPFESAADHYGQTGSGWWPWK